VERIATIETILTEHFKAEERDRQDAERDRQEAAQQRLRLMAAQEAMSARITQLEMATRPAAVLAEQQDKMLARVQYLEQTLRDAKITMRVVTFVAGLLGTAIGWLLNTWSSIKG